jgi:hypothetical protein
LHRDYFGDKLLLPMLISSAKPKNSRMTTMFKSSKNIRRVGLASTALLLATVTAVPALLNSYASAVAQVTARKIVMSVSTPSATAVTYTLTFTPATSLTNPDVIVDFCSNSPLIGDSCTATAGTDVPNMTSAAASTWTVTTIGTNRGIKLTGTHTFTAATPTTITITGVVNPSNVGTNGSFYGRVLTYASGTAGAATSVAPGTYTDYGGIALSTANNISITAKVFETLSFCVFTSSCGGTAPTANLGDTTTGALATSTAYINAQTQYTLASNAGTSVVVTMTGQTLCRAATLSFANCPTGASAATISAIGTTATAVNGAHFGTEQFGMCAGKNGSAALTVATAYNDTVNNCPTTAQATGTYSGTSLFGFDDTSSTGTNNAAGSTVLSSSGAVPTVTSNFAFAANIAATTEAGIYQSNLNLVATGTF